MKKTFLLLAVLAITLTSCCHCCKDKFQRIHVEGKNFVNEQGETVVFRGLCLSDLAKMTSDGVYGERIFTEAAAWGANIVRFPIHPVWLNQTGWDEYFKALDQGIEWAKKNGLYVIIDWHLIGNLKDELYTAEMYNTTKEETFRFWRLVANRYKDEPAVCLYELYNEPTITAPNTGACTWEEHKALLEQIIDEIRAIDPKAVCLCAGFNWAYDLTPVAAAPIQRPNVAYVCHPYPMKRSQPWEEQWEKDFGYVADTYPVLCTELGWCLENEHGAHIPCIATREYGEHITKYLDGKGISFTIWCFDPHWAPTLITDWDFTLSDQGSFFKPYLQSKHACKSTCQDGCKHDCESESKYKSESENKCKSESKCKHNCCEK